MYFSIVSSVVLSNLLLSRFLLSSSSFFFSLLTCSSFSFFFSPKTRRYGTFKPNSVLSTIIKMHVDGKMPLEEALTFATINPAKAVGLDSLKGSVEVGKDADFLVLSADFKLVYVFAKGIPLLAPSAGSSSDCSVVRKGMFV